MKDYTEIWQMKDTITTVVDANGHSVWDISVDEDMLQLELTSHLDENQIDELCSQFPMDADYAREGFCGSVFNLYIND